MVSEGTSLQLQSLSGETRTLVVSHLSHLNLSTHCTSFIEAVSAYHVQLLVYSAMQTLNFRHLECKTLHEADILDAPYAD